MTDDLHAVVANELDSTVDDFARRLMIIDRFANAFFTNHPGEYPRELLSNYNRIVVNINERLKLLGASQNALNLTETISGLQSLLDVIWIYRIGYLEAYFKSAQSKQGIPKVVNLLSLSAAFNDYLQRLLKQQATQQLENQISAVKKIFEWLQAKNNFKENKQVLSPVVRRSLRRGSVDSVQNSGLFNSHQEVDSAVKLAGWLTGNGNVEDVRTFPVDKLLEILNKALSDATFSHWKDNVAINGLLNILEKVEKAKQELDEQTKKFEKDKTQSYKDCIGPKMGDLEDLIELFLENARVSYASDASYAQFVAVVTAKNEATAVPERKPAQ